LPASDLNLALRDEAPALRDPSGSGPRQKARPGLVILGFSSAARLSIAATRFFSKFGFASGAPGPPACPFTFS
jgi:hypothetical protein